MRSRPLAPLALLALLALAWPACSATPDGRPISSSSEGGGTPGGAGPGGGTCPRCEGNLHVPCAGEPVACEPKTCSPDLGCVSCLPGTKACDGSTVLLCAEDGQAQSPAQTCDAAAGQVCLDGACVDACAIAEGSPSNVGCEFWVVDLDNEYSQFNNAAGNPFGVVLSNVGETTAQVVIERNDALPGAPPVIAVVEQRTIEPGTLAEVALPVREVDGSVMGKDEGPGTFLSSNAYRVRSSAPLVAYQFNTLQSSFSNDASLLLPTNGLGAQYRVLGWPTANPIAFGPVIPGIPDHSFVTIVGVEPGTEVTVTLGGPIVGGGGVPASGAGAVITQTLGPFDILNLESDKIPGDLTNTRVVASRPVAVFSGGERGSAPIKVEPPKPPSWDDNGCCTDHLEEQMFPLSALGTRFVASRSPIRSTGGYVESDIIRFLAVEPQTVVTTSLPPPDGSFTLGDGEMREIAVTADFVATSTAPLLIGQVLVSQGWTENPIAGGDPSLTIFPPIEQFRDRYQFLVPTSWAKNYVVVSHPVGAAFTIDGVEPAGCVAATAGIIDATQYDVARCGLTEGVHRVEASAPVGIIVYGYGNVGSYAFVGGADVKTIYEPPK